MHIAYNIKPAVKLQQPLCVAHMLVTIVIQKWGQTLFRFAGSIAFNFPVYMFMTHLTIQVILFM